MTGFVVAVVCVVVMAVLLVVLDCRSRIKDPRVTGLCPECGGKVGHAFGGFFCGRCYWVEKSGQGYNPPPVDDVEKPDPPPRPPTPSASCTLILLGCPCGKMLNIGTDARGWRLDIVGNWVFTCLCGHVFDVGPDGVRLDGELVGDGDGWATRIQFEMVPEGGDE